MCADNGIGYYDAKGELINIDTGDFNSSIDHMTADYQEIFGLHHQGLDCSD